VLNRLLGFALTGETNDGSNHQLIFATSPGSAAFERFGYG